MKNYARKWPYKHQLHHLHHHRSLQPLTINTTTYVIKNNNQALVPYFLRLAMDLNKLYVAPLLKISQAFPLEQLLPSLPPFVQTMPLQLHCCQPPSPNQHILLWVSFLTKNFKLFIIAIKFTQHWTPTKPIIVSVILLSSLLKSNWQNWGDFITYHQLA